MAKLVTRRALAGGLGAGLGLAAGTARAGEPPLLGEPAPLGERFHGKAGFSVAFPPSWLVAYDREAPQQNRAVALKGGDVGALLVPPEPPKEGAVALVANLRDGEVLTVSYTPGVRLAEELERAGGSLSAYVETVVGRIVDTRTVAFELLESELVGADGEGDGPAVSLEYVEAICRGTRGDGLEGRTCTGPKGQELETPERRHVMRLVSAADGGGLFTVNAFTGADRWGTRGATFRKVVESFAVR